MHEGHKQYTENIIFRQKREKVRPFLKDTTMCLVSYLTSTIYVQCTYQDNIPKLISFSVNYSLKEIAIGMILSVQNISKYTCIPADEPNIFIYFSIVHFSCMM